MERTRRTMANLAPPCKPSRVRRWATCSTSIVTTKSWLISTCSTISIRVIIRRRISMIGVGEGKKLGRNFIAIVAVIALGAGLAVAQGGDKQNEGGKNAPAPGFAHGQGPVYRGPGPHFGQWLRRNESLPPDEQLKKL